MCNCIECKYTFEKAEKRLRYSHDRDKTATFLEHLDRAIECDCILCDLCLFDSNCKHQDKEGDLTGCSEGRWLNG